MLCEGFVADLLDRFPTCKESISSLVGDKLIVLYT